MRAAAEPVHRLDFGPRRFGPDAQSPHTAGKIASGSWRPEVIAPGITGMPRPLTIFWQTRKSSFIKWQWHGDADTFCPPIWADLATGSGPCGLGCRYCFLMLTFREMRNAWSPVVYDNFDTCKSQTRKFLAASESRFGKKGHRRRTSMDSIGLGIDCADSLLLEGVTGHVKRLAPLFASPKTNPLGNPLVLLTKSANAHYLEEVASIAGATEKIVVTFSLNPEAVADTWEGKYADGLRMTPPIDARLAAMKRAQDLGFEVRARIDPILPIGGWQALYDDFFVQMADLGIRPTQLTLGTYREKNAQLDTFRDRWSLPAPEWSPLDEAEGGVVRDGTHFHVTDRAAIYRRVAVAIESAYRTSPFDPYVSLCKETHEVRRACGMLTAECNCLRSRLAQIAATVAR